MSWADGVMRSLDARATVLRTARGDVQVAREGRGPPVLVSHGGPGGFDQGLAASRHLRDGGCELIAPSRPGYLRTPLDLGRRPEEQADLYAALLDALGLERVAILGFSSGGPSAVHFAARHPGRTTALFLDSAILLPFTPGGSALRRATYESSFLAWLSYELAKRKPGMLTRFTIDGMSKGLSKQQKRAAARWIERDPVRRQGIREMWVSIAPWKYRKRGWNNDKLNEAELEPLPFAAVIAPTVIAYGANDGIVPLEHAANAAARIAGAELIRVEEGYHALSLSRNYGPVAQRQLELARNPDGVRE